MNQTITQQLLSRSHGDVTHADVKAMGGKLVERRSNYAFYEMEDGSRIAVPFKREQHKREAARQAMAYKNGRRSKFSRREIALQRIVDRIDANQKIVPDHVAPGSKEHLDRLSEFFGI